MDTNMNVNMENQNNVDHEDVILTIINNGIETECIVISVFKAWDYDYIALLPNNESSIMNEGLWLYRLSYIDDNPVFEEIFADEEYELVADTLNEIMEDQGYADLVWKHRQKYMKQEEKQKECKCTEGVNVCKCK